MQNLQTSPALQLVPTRAYSFAAVHYLEPTGLLGKVLGGPARPTRLVVRPLSDHTQLERLFGDAGVKERLRSEQVELRPLGIVQATVGRQLRPAPLLPLLKPLRTRGLCDSGFLDEKRLARAIDGKAFERGERVAMDLPAMKYGEMRQVLVRIDLENEKSAHGVEVSHYVGDQLVGGLYILFTPSARVR